MHQCCKRFGLFLIVVIAGAPMTASFGDTIFESFEGNLGPWHAAAGPYTMTWHVTPSRASALDGQWSLAFTTDGTCDNGTVWAVRQLQLPAGTWTIGLQFNVTAATIGSMTAWHAVGFIGLREPLVETDFTGSPEGEDLGLIEASTPWKTCTMQRTLTVSSPSVAYVAFGYNIVWETVRTHYFDAVTLTGVPVQCGNGQCFGGENACNCPADCGLPAATESSCTNGSDDDCDNLIDCADLDCSGNAACAGIVCDGDGVCEAGETACVCWMDCGSPPVEETSCSNEIDDDCDGEVDCDDLLNCGMSFECLSPTTYTLTVSVTGQGSVTLNPPGGSYDPGTTVTLTAVPAAGWQFDHWSGALSGSANPATLVMNANQMVTAVFTSPAPTAPSNVTATSPSRGKARVNWQDNSTNETGFEIQREKKVGGQWKNTTTISVGANVVTYLDSPGAGSYRYRVRACNAAGCSAYSAWATVTVR